MDMLANTPNVGWTASPYDRRIESLDSTTVFNQSESSVAATRVVETPDITPPSGIRYSMLKCNPYRNSLIYLMFSVYYRLYTEDESVPSVNPIYSNDPSLGCISANVITPPHTAISLKRCLLAVENIDASISTSLFVTASTKEPLADNAKVSIVQFPGPGCTPNEPMALVAKVSGADRSAIEIKKTKQSIRLFNKSGLYNHWRSTQKFRVTDLETHYCK
jgi:hypothetical protein